MAKTVCASYLFAVKEYGDGTPWIMLEPREKGIKFAGGGFLGFDLPEGTGIKKAEEIAQYLNENLRDLKLTTF